MHVQGRSDFWALVFKRAVLNCGSLLTCSGNEIVTELQDTWHLRQTKCLREHAKVVRIPPSPNEQGFQYQTYSERVVVGFDADAFMRLP